jgi:hypothetical protein
MSTEGTAEQVCQLFEYSRRQILRFYGLGPIGTLSHRIPQVIAAPCCGSSPASYHI